MSFRTIRLEERANVTVVTIDRPAQNNAINEELIGELQGALDRAEGRADGRMVVLQGTGGVFCTGLDFEAARAGFGAAGDELAGGGESFFGLLRRITAFPQVVVSLVDGRVAAGGVGLVAASDFVVATDRSQFSLPEALWGLLPCCVLPFLMRRIGFRAAYSLTLTTLPIGADEARRTGLVDEVSNEAESLLRRFAFRFIKLAPATVRDLKRYFAGLSSISAECERLAVGEFRRLMSSSLVRSNISTFVTQRRFPWEAGPDTAPERPSAR